MARVDLVALSQTKYARTLRRDLNSLDSFIDFDVRPSRMPVRRAPGRTFRALESAEAWIWGDGGKRASRYAAIAAVAAIALVIVLHTI